MQFKIPETAEVPGPKDYNRFFNEEPNRWKNPSAVDHVVLRWLDAYTKDMEHVKLLDMGCGTECLRVMVLSYWKTLISRDNFHIWDDAPDMFPANLDGLDTNCLYYVFLCSKHQWS